MTMTPEDELLQRLERESREGSERLRAMLREMGRDDLLADYDRDMRDIRLGVTMARSCWHSISPKQRFVLKRMGEGRSLRRMAGSRTRYDAIGSGRGGPDAMREICDFRTARKLAAHELIHVAGGALDPEAVFVITERGSFVLAHGATP